VSSVLEGDDGTLWIVREAFTDGQREVLITDAQLTPIATLHVPTSAVSLLPPVTRASVWVDEKDDLDVRCLARYRVRR
jgi:hypothetical protein